MSLKKRPAIHVYMHEYFGKMNGKNSYGRARAFTVYGLSRDEVYEKIIKLFSEGEKEDVE